MKTQTSNPTLVRAIVLGLLLFITGIGFWQLATTNGWFSDLAPSPALTFSRAVEILSNPFYRDGPSSVGIFWHILASLQRVLIGFLIATVIAIPLGFALGRLTSLRWALDPLIQVLRPVSPLAWLPLGLALLSNAEKTAVFVIVLSALWPTLINTIDAVRNVNPHPYQSHCDFRYAFLAADYSLMDTSSATRNYYWTTVVAVHFLASHYCS